MIQFITRRILMIIPSALGVVTLVFFIIHLTPGDPIQAMLGDEAPWEAVEALRAQLGLDRPLHEQYFSFLTNLMQGDLGRSIRTPREVGGEIRRVLPYTLELAGAAMLIGLVFGLPLGIVQAVKRNTIQDYAASTISIIWYSAPIFLVALVGMYLFSLRFKIFPLTGAGTRGDLGSTLYYLILPSLSLGLRRIALIARMMRSSVLEVMGQDYIRTARSKGLTEMVVIYRHAIKNAIIPVITAAGMEFGTLLGGAVITETIFVRPGLGRLTVMAIFSRDYPIVQGNLLIFALVFMCINLLVDLSYAFFDPRIRYD